MAKLTIRILTTGAEFETSEIDFTQYTPQQIIDNMRGNLPPADQGKVWNMLKGNQLIDQQATLDQLGFRDGDTAALTGKVEAA